MNRAHQRSLVTVSLLAASLAMASSAHAGDPDAAPEPPLACRGSLRPDPERAVVPQGCYLDIDRKLRNSSEVYDARLSALKPFHLLTLGELSLFLGAGALWYAIDNDRNLADFDFPSWEQRFSGEAWTFDNNHFPINFIGHPLSGGMYYAMPRANDHAVWVASSYALMTSFLWEFVIEFREKVSVNDLLITFGAGVTIGEFGHKLWRYTSGIPMKSTVVQDFLAATLGFPVSVKRAIEGEPQAVEGPYDEHGFSNQIGQRLEAGYRVRLHDYGKRVTTHGVRLGGRLSSIPGDGRPGDFSLFFHEADIVELWLAGGGGNNAREWDLRSDMQVLGLYGQRIDTSGNGYSGVLALNMGYRFLFQDFDGYNDRLGIAHFPGIGTDFRLRAGPIALRTYWRMNPDFAGVHAAAFPAWRDAAVGDDDTEKTILRKRGYYFAWGLSSRFGGKLQLGPVDLSAAGRIGVYDSQEGLDRNQRDITLDVNATDRVLEFESQVGFTVPTTRFRLGIGWGITDRRSRVADIQVDRSIQTWTLGVGAAL